MRFRYPGPPERTWGPADPDDPADAGDWFEVIGVVRELGVGAPATAGRAAGLQRVNKAHNDVLWVMTLWLRITVVLSAVALALSLAGIYAVLSYTVARRTSNLLAARSGA